MEWASLAHAPHTINVPEGRGEIHPFLRSVLPDWAVKQGVHAGIGLIQEGDEVVLHHRLGLGVQAALLISKVDANDGSPLSDVEFLVTTSDPKMTLTIRKYIKGNSTQRFAERLHSVVDIAPEVFQDYAGELMRRTGRVTAVLDIDLDRGEFSTLDALNGWETYTIRDVSTAAWHANRNDRLGREQRLDIFAGRLEQLGIAPPERLTSEGIGPQEQPEAAPFEQTM